MKSHFVFYLPLFDELVTLKLSRLVIKLGASDVYVQVGSEILPAVFLGRL